MTIADYIDLIGFMALAVAILILAWRERPSASEAASALAKLGAEKRRLSEAERQANMTARLVAERDAARASR